MKPRMIAVLAVLAMVLAACGGADDVVPVPGADQATVPGEDDQSEPGTSDQGDTGDAGTSGSDEPTPEASGPLGENMIRIGDQTWERTLPMTTGQCFLYEDDGTLPDSGNAWGTLDGEEDLRFAARYSQDGTFESEVNNNEDMYWGSGPRFGEDDLVIELDFENQTISGSGTFILLNTGERAMGSFQFTCEPDE
ncbi:MAG: hypothetical protein WDZ96_03865 [Acidimicrobiia bacterium]